MAHGRDRIDPTLGQLAGRIWRALLVALIAWVAWLTLEAGMRQDVALTLAMVGVLLALAVLLLASSIVAVWGGR
ncbi:hypothetical protein [Nonomuraea sp. bgisy101]|uniref:hypothetical protein n=1 Tax=Nonomuraea sp. bgisy101 TaxID=3413784 RepID=UPI003D75AE96